MTRNTRMYEITVWLHASTDKAILVSSNGNDAQAEWLPLSQIEFDFTGKHPKEITAQVPQWLLEERGLEHLVDA